MKKRFCLFIICFFCFYIHSNEITSAYKSSCKKIQDLFIGQAILLGNVELLSDNEINDISLSLLNIPELRLLRNSIYAKYGYIFSSGDLKKHFEQFDWYKPRSKNVDDYLSELDKRNIEKIKMFEESHANTIAEVMLPKYYGEVWSRDIVVASAHNDYFIFEDSENIKFRFRENTPLKILYGFNGKYKIINGELDILIQELLVHFPDSQYEENGINGIDWTTNDYTILSLDKPLNSTFPIENIGTKKIFDFESTYIKIGSEYYYLH